jgi:hypothetical protein
MGPQVYEREAMGDLHQILFRPSASLFSPKLSRKNKWSSEAGKFVKIDSKTYSPCARSFLEDKALPSATDYFKGTKIFTQRPKRKSMHSTRWRKNDLFQDFLAVPERKGGLSSDVVKTIWGSTKRRTSSDDRRLEAEANELIHKVVT